MLFVLLISAAALPGEPPAASVCFSDGQTALAAGSYAVAREHFDCARANAPEWALAHLHWAIAQMGLDGTSPEAVAALERSVQLAPQNPRAHYYLGLALSRAERFDDAAAALERSIALRYEMTDAHFLLGDVRRAQGRADAAIEAFERALAQNERHLGVLAALAMLFEQVGRGEDAEKMLLAIVQLQPEIAYHQYNLAQFYSRIGDDKKARVAFQRAEAIDPRPKRKMRKLR